MKNGIVMPIAAKMIWNHKENAMIERAAKKASIQNRQNEDSQA